MFKYNYNRQTLLIKMLGQCLAIIFLTIIITQSLFYFIQYSSSRSTSQGMNDYFPEILRDKNAIDFSQSITQLEFLGLIKCSKVTKVWPQDYLLLDLSSRPDCSSKYNEWLLNGVNYSVDLQLTNGEEWRVAYVINNTPWFYIILWISRVSLFLFLLITYYFFKRFLDARISLEREKIAGMKRIYDISSQVSHDIKSPLSALKMAIEEIDNIPEAYQSLIHASVQRINDIANNLLNANKEIINKGKDHLSVELIGPIVDSLVSEKKMQYRSRNIEILNDLTKSDRLFSSINKSELSRVLSNVINNSVEAVSDNGKVLVSVFEENTKVIIKIQDNGKGIPESVLNQIGKQGFSYGKVGMESGTGLGIHHAKSTLASFNGALEIHSVLNEGTIVKISLPQAETPHRFATEGVLQNEISFLSANIFDYVYIENEILLTMTWENRARKNNINLLTLTTVSDFQNYTDQISKEKTLIYIDYHLGDDQVTGEDFAKKLYDEGYQNLFIASGYEDSKFAHLPWLKVAGKKCPF